jgi:hypothetical protein
VTPQRLADAVGARRLTRCDGDVSGELHASSNRDAARHHGVFTVEQSTGDAPVIRRSRNVARA